MMSERIARLVELVETGLGLRLEPASAQALIARHGEGVVQRLGDPAELRAFAPELIVGETYFYRHAEQLHAYRDVALARALAAGRTPRVLSAGCATGEEPYTLAMLGGPADILGIDVSATAIARARRGRYTRWALRALPPELEARWFVKAGAEYELARELREKVAFQQMNLADPFALPAGTYDVIFCRNVIMYFAEPQADALLHRFVRALVPGGHLFLGHAELLHRALPGLAVRESHGTFYYERVSPRPDHAWADAIHRASDRVRALGGAPSPAPSPEPSPEPEAPVVLSEAIAGIHARLADEDFAGALAELDDLPPELASAPEVMLLRAVVLTEHGDAGRAAAACDALLRAQPNAASAHYLLAVRRESHGDLAGALREAILAAELAPEFALAHLRAGLLARRTGDPAQARTELARAIAALPREAPERLLLHAGGLGRATLVTLCEIELAAIEAEAGAR